MDAYAYADLIASTESGNYLDHGVRVNSVFSSYRISDTDFSQRFGDIAGPSFNEDSPWGYTPRQGTGMGLLTLFRTLELVAGEPV